MQGPFSVEIVLVGVGFSKRKNKGRLLEAVPPPHAYRFTHSNFGDWVEVTLTTE